MQVLTKIHYRHHTVTTRMRINTSIYHRPLLTTGNFTGTYIISTINRIYHYRHTIGTLNFYTTGNEKIPACR